MACVAQHVVLLKGFRRVRDYSFLLVLKKALAQSGLTPPYIQKKIFAYIEDPAHEPGLSNQWIRLWFVPHTIYPYLLESKTFFSTFQTIQGRL